MKNGKRKGLPIRIASDECALRIWAFANELAALCRKYELEVTTSDDCNNIDLVDVKRPANEDWPCVASFAGCEATGPYSAREFGDRHVDGIDLSEVEPEFPEDYASIAKAKAEGKPW